MAFQNKKPLLITGLALCLGFLALASGQDKFEQDKLYKVCGAVDDSCLSAYDNVPPEDDAELGQVTTQDYTEDPKQKWMVRAPFDQTNTKEWSSFYPKDYTNYYNNVTLAYKRKWAAPNLWKVIDTGNLLYTLRLEKYSDKNEKDDILGCLEHLGNGNNVWLSPCDDGNANQKWKFGLLE